MLDVDLRELYIKLSVYNDQGLIRPVQASSTISMETACSAVWGGGERSPSPNIMNRITGVESHSGQGKPPSGSARQFL